MRLTATEIIELTEALNVHLQQKDSQGEMPKKALISAYDKLYKNRQKRCLQNNRKAS